MGLADRTPAGICLVLTRAWLGARLVLPEVWMNYAWCHQGVYIWCYQGVNESMPGVTEE